VDIPHTETITQIQATRVLREQGSLTVTYLLLGRWLDYQQVGVRFSGLTEILFVTTFRLIWKLPRLLPNGHGVPYPIDLSAGA